ncbi:hypothetical protein V6Z05_14925 [Leptospira venezuelensis]|uniref:hypothetical protein n=1 Tax=Leptospira venezuelensis TaxID=1958811 RepID=UPI000A3B719D|nr:hypothetical protein [Leptospira venezuelensis]
MNNNDLEQEIEAEKKSFTKSFFSSIIVYSPFALICTLMEDSGFGKAESNIILSLVKFFFLTFLSYIFLSLYKSESIRIKYSEGDSNYKKPPFKLHFILLIVGILILAYQIKLIILAIAMGIYGSIVL